uniref:Uncharacterized protein n=1 Tax=Arundo donax TaxID=35708 RepID=A0A0A9F317_ARUDO
MHEENKQNLKEMNNHQQFFSALLKPTKIYRFS